MFTVYSITNLINQKKYIGSSIRVEKRWKQHQNDAFNPNSSKYNYPLYKAFRKYGIENFEFSILKDDFNNEKQMQQYQYNMIVFYNSYNNGYNQTYKTQQSTIAKENLNKYLQKISKKCAKVNINEEILEIYNSYHEAARKNGFNGDNTASHIRRVCKGELSNFHNLIFRDLDENNKIIHQQIKNFKGRKKIIGIKISDPTQEIFYDSISEAARSLNLDRGSISKCIQGNQRYSHVGGYLWRQINIYGDIIEIIPTIEDFFNNYNEKNPLINGERHNINEWCKIFNISKSSFYARKRKGMNTIEALTKKKVR